MPSTPSSPSSPASTLPPSIGSAAALIPDDPGVAALREELTAVFGAWDGERKEAEKQALADAAAVTANAQARERWKLGKELRQAGKLDEAAAEYTAALTLAQHPSLRESLVREQTELETLRAAAAADRNRQEVLRLAGQVRAIAATAAAELDALPVPDEKLVASGSSAQTLAAYQNLDRRIQDAVGVLAEARSLQVATPELDAAAEALAVQRTRVQQGQGQLRSWQQRQVDSIALSDVAQHELQQAAGDEAKLQAIRTQALRANSLFPGNAQALTVLADADAGVRAGAKMPADLKIDGRSLVPLLKDAKAGAGGWTDRTLVTHVGRWPRGKAADAKYANMSIRNSRYTLVNNKELYDLKADYGEKNNIADQNPDMVAELRLAYDKWWNEVLPLLENEDLDGPKVNPFHELYWQQFPEEKPKEGEKKGAKENRKTKGESKVP